MTGAVRRGMAATTLAVGLGCCVPIPVSADVERTAIYPGPSYATDHEAGRGLRVSSPTYAKAQSKTWWYDGAWWALLYDPAGADVRVAELTTAHKWRLTRTVVAHDPLAVGDVVVDGNRIHTVVRDRSGLLAKSLRYRPHGRFYAVEPGSPLRLGVRGTSSATMAQDSTGRLWITFARDSRLSVLHSDRGQRNWTAPYTPDVGGTATGPREMSDVVAANGAITVIWSDQKHGAFHAAVHRDGTSDRSWSGSTIVSGPKLADDHVNAHVVPTPEGDVVLVAVKTSRNDFPVPDADDPLILLLARDPRGQWSERVVSTVGDGWTRPVVTADASGTVYVFARRAGSIVFKETTVPDLSFNVGQGRHLLRVTDASFTDPTLGTQTPDAVTGVLVLVSDDMREQYWHAELAVAGSALGASRNDNPDREAPAAPTQVEGRSRDGTVHLTWNPSVEPVRWKPAGQVPPVRYVVLRDGERVGDTSVTSFSLRHGGGRHQYEVLAVDRAGNSSQAAVAALLTIERQSGGTGSRWLLLGGALVALVALGAGGYAHLRRQLGRTAQALAQATVPMILPAPKGKHARH